MSFLLKNKVLSESMEPKIVMDYYRGYEAILSMTAVLECWTRVLMISLLFVRIIAVDIYCVDPGGLLLFGRNGGVPTRGEGATKKGQT